MVVVFNWILGMRSISSGAVLKLRRRGGFLNPLRSRMIWLEELLSWGMQGKLGRKEKDNRRGLGGCR